MARAIISFPLIVSAISYRFFHNCRLSLPIVSKNLLSLPSGHCKNLDPYQEWVKLTKWNCSSLAHSTVRGSKPRSNLFDV